MKKIVLLLTITSSIISYSQITDANFNQAISTCLSTNPIDGMCSDSEYGAMPDWDVSQVTSMEQAFSERADFNADISGWDVSNVITMHRMFWRAFQFNQPIGNWDTGNVQDMSFMFSGYHVIEHQFNQPIGQWNTSNVTDMTRMFFYSLFNQSISSWDVSNVTSMANMFHVTPFNQPINNWNVENVKKHKKHYELVKRMKPRCVCNFCFSLFFAI